MNPEPIKMITTYEKVAIFQSSDTYKNLLDFIVELQQSVFKKRISDTPRLKEFETYNHYFNDLKAILKETPPIEGKTRFGNLAFRNFHEKLVGANKEFVSKLLFQLDLKTEHLIELKIYLDEAYGDKSRIDYGTGHELNFMIFLFCVNKLKPYQKEALASVVHQIFYDYIFLIRSVQLQYNLEPAGSHGVWGLDDYHFLTFIFGGAELVDNQIFKTPKFVHEPLLVEQYKNEFMYLNCISFIRMVKKSVPFAESSPILNDISGAASWLKVATGMIKMYQVEVLGKFPVVQHIRFGKLFEFK